MVLYAILASPLMVSADFRHMRKSSKDILLNPGVIAINQDPLGIQGRRIKTVSESIIGSMKGCQVPSQANFFDFPMASTRCQVALEDMALIIRFCSM